jgi:hypothetical protein
MTVNFKVAIDFYLITLSQARDLVYGDIVPCCEESNVLLSSDGNLAGSEASSANTIYLKQRKDHKLFDVGRAQRAFRDLDRIVVQSERCRINSFELKHIVQEYQGGERVGNGDLILAMLAKGCPAHFGKKDGLNCQFKVEVIWDRNPGRLPYST